MKTTTVTRLSKEGLLTERLKEAKNRFNSIKSLKDDDTNKLEELKKIISKVEIIPEITFEFLKVLKIQNASYEENGEHWDYSSNFNMLNETLTSDQYQSLEKKLPNNPLNILINFLKTISITKTEDYQKLLADKINYILNFPLIYGIERLRLWYYINYIKNINTFENIQNMKDYISNIEKDKDITETNVDSNEFSLKIYLLVLYVSDLMSQDNVYYANQYFLKDIRMHTSIINATNLNINQIRINKKENNQYSLSNKFEDEITIKEEDYIIDFLIGDILSNPSYPLKTLLFRNESFIRFKKYGGFIKELNLYKEFINYLKLFIKSRCVQEILSSNEYRYIKELINNTNYLDSILTDTYFKFIPYFGVKNIFGFTNKDILLSTVNSIPEIAILIEYKTKESYKGLYHLSILLSICVKFITAIHEVLIHLTSGYINFVTEKRVDSGSPKTNLNPVDGGYAFEEKLSGNDKFSSLTLQSVIVLLDGITCNKELSEFQKELNKTTDINSIIEKKKNGLLKGFLADFFQKYDIDFSIFNKEKVQNINIKCRSVNEISVSMETSRALRTCSGGGKEKSKKNV